MNKIINALAEMVLDEPKAMQEFESERYTLEWGKVHAALRVVAPRFIPPDVQKEWNEVFNMVSSRVKELPKIRQTQAQIEAENKAKAETVIEEREAAAKKIAELEQELGTLKAQLAEVAKLVAYEEKLKEAQYAIADRMISPTISDVTKASVSADVKLPDQNEMAEEIADAEARAEVDADVADVAEELDAIDKEHHG